jgi:hypothetical protein
VYNIGEEAITSRKGTLLSIPVDGEVKSVEAEAADYYGNPIDVSTRMNPALPEKFITSIYPNPFNPRTTIALSFAQAGEVNIEIYNIAGQLVKRFSGHYEAGTVKFIWHGDDLDGNAAGSGVYFMKAQYNNSSTYRKLVLLK